MLNFPPAVRVFVALAPVDLRGSFNRLCALARNQLSQDPLSRPVTMRLTFGGVAG